MLKDRVALVTGGSRGIGKAIVERLLREGARVAFCGRDREALAVSRAELSVIGPEVLALQADVTNERDVRELIGATLDRFAGLDILVNNAGVYGPIGPAWENDPAEWRETVMTNLVGVFLVCRAVVPALIRAGRGKIINISGGGAATPFPRFSAYAVSKAALVRFTETLALELKENNIQVNAVAPGFVVTRFHEQTLQAGERAGVDFLKKTQEQIAQGGVDSTIPAGLVAFLASDRADRITGKFFSSVWDDWSSFEAHLDEIEGTDV